jgi:soluble lytic murein transglycosylase-like protein
VALAALCVLAGRPARAELAYFSSGDSLSIKDHREEGDSLVLRLRAGGEIVCDRALIVRFAPDEVPYPEPPDPAATTAGQAPAVASLANMELYGEIIDRVAAQHHVDARLVRAMISVESAYQERARSRKGAMGLMQLMPETARRFNVTDPYNPQANIEGGIRYLRTLLDRFPSGWPWRYNAGEAAVERFRVPPYAETRICHARPAPRRSISLPATKKPFQPAGPSKVCRRFYET